MLFGIISLVVAILLAVIDQLIKIAVVDNIPLGDKIPVIEGLLDWHYVKNEGMAFGMLADSRWIFISTTIILVIVMSIFLFTKYCNSKFYFIAITLFIGGGIGNLIDRLFLGYVVDYIHFSFFPYIFNFADACVCVGGAIFALYFIYKETAKEKLNKVGLEDKKC